MWVYDEDIGMNCRDITYVPGLYKIFDEILGELYMSMYCRAPYIMSGFLNMVKLLLFKMLSSLENPFFFYTLLGWDPLHYV